MDSGFIMLHRKLMDSSIWMDSEAVHLWVRLLFHANFKDKKIIHNGSEALVKRGQFVTGRKKLSLSTGINESKIQRLLKLFEKCHMIEQQTNSTSRLISILNYDLYQSSEQQVNSERTASEQRVTTNNNVNNSNNVNKDIEIPEFIELSLWNDFLSMRKKVKAVNSERAIKAIIKKLSKTPKEANDMIEQSIVSSWKDVYPIKDENKVKTFSDYGKGEKIDYGETDAKALEGLDDFVSPWDHITEKDA